MRFETGGCACPDSAGDETPGPSRVRQVPCSPTFRTESADRNRRAPPRPLPYPSPWGRGESAPRGERTRDGLSAGPPPSPPRGGGEGLKAVRYLAPGGW